MTPPAGVANKVALVAAGALLLAAALTLAPGRRPVEGGQVALWLAVESRALDADLLFEAKDADRFRAHFGDAALRGFHLREQREVAIGRDGRPREAPALRAPWLWTWLASGARAIGGWSALFFLQWVLVFGAALLALWGTRPSLGSSGSSSWVLLGVFASSAALAALYLVPEALHFFLLALAGAVLWGRRALPTVEVGQVYGGDLERGVAWWRFVVAGSAFGVVATGAPSYLPLAWPLLAAAPPGRRSGGSALFVATAGVTFALLVLAGGRPWPPLELWYDPALLGWAGFGLLFGRAAGVVVAFLPALLAFAAPARDEGRRWIPWALLASAALHLLTSPFDLAGDSGSPGNAWFLPLFALLLLLPVKLPARAGRVAVAVASLLLIAPAWLAVAGLEGRSWVRPLARLHALLPLDSTLRDLPGAATLDHRSGIVVRGFGPEVFAGADGRLRIAGATAALVVESAAPLASLRLEFGADAPASFEVRGGRMGDVVLRPSGEVAVDVALDAPARRHPTARSPRGASIYLLRLDLPKAPAAPLAFDFSIARPIGSEEATP